MIQKYIQQSTSKVIETLEMAVGMPTIFCQSGSYSMCHMIPIDKE